MEQNDPNYLTYETSQSLEIQFDLVNNAEQIYVNSSEYDYFDNFNVTIDQLEGEITTPYQFINRKEQGSNFQTGETFQRVDRRIIVPNSILGGFAQFRINYTFTEFPEEPQYGEGDNQGTYIAGSFNTERLLVPRRPYIPPPPPPPTFSFNKNEIKEALADKIYDSFFNSDEIDVDLGNINKLQSAVQSDGFIRPGRESNQKVVFFKKDRNTPENKKDFNSGNISLIVSDISGSLSAQSAVGTVNISEFLDDELQVLPKVVSDRIASEEMFIVPGSNEVTDQPLYYYNITTYKIQYKDIDPIIFAEYKTFYASNEGNSLYKPDFITPRPIEWTNILNLSQITKPVRSKKIDPDKAEKILDTKIYELLPSQPTRQEQINQFFLNFNNLIGGTPTFEDVDDDGAGELLLSDGAPRISQEPDNPASFITRIESDAIEDEQNQGQTLEYMRDTLNNYLGDVDNVIEEPIDERPEYENKSEGFLKIRKLNQAIIIRNNVDINVLEKEITSMTTQRNGSYPDISTTGPSWMVNGFTITMWVRFINNSSEGSLFSYGNPHQFNEASFRLDTLTRAPGDVFYPPSGGYPASVYTTPRRIIRLSVWDTLIPNTPRYYENNVGGKPAGEINSDGRWGTGQSFSKRDPNGRSGYGNGSNTQLRSVIDYHPSNFPQFTEIPTDNTDEWFFICATYNPMVREDISLKAGFKPNSVTWEGEDVYSFFQKNPLFWENHRNPINNELIPFSRTGNKCKVEVISRSDLLRARGYRVDE